MSDSIEEEMEDDAILKYESPNTLGRGLGR